MDAKPLSRSFTCNGVKLPDPDPRMTAEGVKSLYSHQYPELATAAIYRTRGVRRADAVELCEGDRDKGLAAKQSGEGKSVAGPTELRAELRS